MAMSDTPPRPVEATRADLQSGDPARIRAALAELEQRHRMGQEFELPLPDVRLLDPFGDDVPTDVQRLFVDVVSKYRSIPASAAERLSRMVELILRYANGQAAFDSVLEVKVSEDPPAMAADTMRELRRQKLDTPVAVKGAKYLVSRLLDSRAPMRAAVLAELASWPRESPYGDVVTYVAPQLEPSELEQLHPRT
jgi:hypothetical protein